MLSKKNTTFVLGRQGFFQKKTKKNITHTGF